MQIFLDEIHYKSISMAFEADEYIIKRYQKMKLEEGLPVEPNFIGKVIVTDNLRTHLKDQPGESMGCFISTVRSYLEYSWNE
ncbi:hypothetical protein ACFL0J_05275 [Candidatus Neomarinimicrobiota bacterium]